MFGGADRCGGVGTIMSAKDSNIHSTAIVSPSAVIGEGTTIGPYSVIGSHVVLGSNNKVASHVVIEGHTRIGDGNTIYQFASVGAHPQDLKYKGEPSELLIGNNNIIREYATLQPGTEGGGMLTKIGNGNLFMATTHVGHDSTVGDKCVMANGAGLAGHVTIGNGVIVGGFSGIHQFVRIGDIAMVGAGSMVSQDIPPFCIAQGDRASIHGLNRIGLDRNGCSKEEFGLLRELYGILFLQGIPEVEGKVFKERVAYAQTRVGDSKWASAFVSFINASERGIMPHHASLAAGKA